MGLCCHVIDMKFFSNPIRFKEFENCLNNVVDMNKITSLQAISIDGRWLLIHNEINKFWNDGSICRIRSLTNSVHVEEAECDGF